MNDEESRTSYEADEAAPREPECDPVSAPLSRESADTGEDQEIPDAGAEADECGGKDPAPCACEGISCDPVQDADPSAAADPADGAEADAAEQLRELRSELTALRAEIAARDERLSRMGAEYAEFRTLYPSVPLETIDDCVMADVKNGIPLAAAYALAERKRKIAEEQAARINAENSHRTAGALRATDEEYFTPDEVRKMTQGEVHANYQKILRSMRKWH